MFEIFKVLTLSTAHLRKETAEALELGIRQDFDDPEWLDQLSFDSHEFGWWVWVDDGERTMSDLPPDEIFNAMRLAREHDCTWIRYDQDAIIIDDLPSWDW